MMKSPESISAKTATEIIQQLVYLVDNQSTTSFWVQESAAQCLYNFGKTPFRELAWTIAENQLSWLGIKFRAYLQDWDQATQELLEQLGNPNLSRACRAQAAADLASIGNTEDRVLKALVIQLSSEQLRLRAAEAIIDLVAFCENTNYLEELLQAYFKDANYWTHYYSAMILSYIRPQLSESFEFLYKSLNSSHDVVIDRAIRCLFHLGDRSSRFLESLDHIILHQDGWIWYQAAMSKLLMGLGDDQLVDSLLASYEKNLKQVFYGDHVSASELIIKLANYDQIDYGIELVDCWASISIRNFITGLSEDQNQILNFWSRFEYYGCYAKEIQSILIDTALTAPDSRIRSMAVRALGQLGYQSETIQKLLKKSLNEEVLKVRCSAAIAICQRGNLDDVERALQTLLNWDPYHGSLSRTLVCLCQITGDVIPMIDAWLSLQKNDYFIGRGVDLLWELVIGPRLWNSFIDS